MIVSGHFNAAPHITSLPHLSISPRNLRGGQRGNVGCFRTRSLRRSSTKSTTAALSSLYFQARDMNRVHDALSRSTKNENSASPFTITHQPVSCFSTRTEPPRTNLLIMVGLTAALDPSPGSFNHPLTRCSCEDRPHRAWMIWLGPA